MVLIYYGTVVESQASDKGGWQVAVDVQSVVQLYADGEQFSAPMEARVAWVLPAPLQGHVVVLCNERGQVLGVAEVGLEPS